MVFCQVREYNIGVTKGVKFLNKCNLLLCKSRSVNVSPVSCLCLAICSLQYYALLRRILVYSATVAYVSPLDLPQFLLFLAALSNVDRDLIRKLLLPMSLDGLQELMTQSKKLICRRQLSLSCSLIAVCRREPWKVKCVVIVFSADDSFV